MAAPTPGSVVSHLASCRWMASAISLIGRTSALIALRMPTLSTVQNSSKNSSSASAEEADQPRHHPALHRVAVEVMARVQRDLLADAASAGCRRTNSGTSTWYSSGPTWRRTSSSRTRFSMPVILVIMRLFSAGSLLQVVVAQGRRQGVGHVGRLGQLRQAQLAHDGPLHLLLARPAVPGDRLLDPRGVVADHRHLCCAAARKITPRAGPSGSPSADGRSGRRAARPPSPRAGTARSLPLYHRTGTRAAGAMSVVAVPSAMRMTPASQTRGRAGDFEDGVAGDLQAGIDAEDREAMRHGADASLTFGQRRRARRTLNELARRRHPTRQLVPPGRSSSVTPSSVSRLRIWSPSAKFFALRASLREVDRDSCIRPADELLVCRRRLLSAGGFPEQAEDLAQLLEHDARRARSSADRPALALPASSLLLVGEAVERGQQFVQHADRAAGVEVVVHVLEELSPQPDDLADELAARPAGVERRPTRRALQVRRSSSSVMRS